MAETHTFQAEVSRLLDIVAHSLYSDKQIFLRELIANAADACDKLRYAALTDPDLAGDGNYAITLTADKDSRTVKVADNGIGMSHDDMVGNLGTIAKSGTSDFLAQISGDAKKDTNLIGQFGVGFYSAFMVAEKVEVVSRKAGEDEAWRWTSDGKGSFEIEPAIASPLLEVPERGTVVIVHLTEDHAEFADAARLREVVRAYADHIAVPVSLAATDEAGEDGAPEVLNKASALWTRPKSEIDDDQYKEFYQYVGQAFDDPWLTIHFRAEGVIEYTALMFVPTSRPFDLFRPERKHGLKLYVKRVFITDDCEGLVPGWMRFVRGVVDSPDVPLNVSREMLQHNPVLGKIRSGLVKRVLSELDKKAEKAPDDYATFWEAFGPVMKEGIYEDDANRDALLKLARFTTTRTVKEGGKPISLADYIGRMAEGQEAIFYATGDNLEALKRSPQLEGFAARDVEVLLLTDPVDEFWVPAVHEFEGKALTSVARGGADLDKIARKDAAAEESDGKDKKEQKKDDAAPAAIDAVIAAFKVALGDAVEDVKSSNRLTDSPVCLVAGENAMSMHLERLLKSHGQLENLSQRVLELNPGHPLVKRLNDMAAKDAKDPVLDEAAHLLLDQARILEGEPVPDPAAFARRMSQVMVAGLA